MYRIIQLLRQHCVLGSFLFPYISFITGCCTEQLRLSKCSHKNFYSRSRNYWTFAVQILRGTHSSCFCHHATWHSSEKNSFWKRIASRQRKHARHHSEQVWRCNFTLFKECYPPACNRLPSLVVNNTLEHALVGLHRELIVQCIKVYNLGKL